MNEGNFVIIVLCGAMLMGFNMSFFAVAMPLPKEAKGNGIQGQRKCAFRLLVSGGVKMMVWAQDLALVDD